MCVCRCAQIMKINDYIPECFERPLQFITSRKEFSYSYISLLDPLHEIFQMVVPVISTTSKDVILISRNSHIHCPDFWGKGIGRIKKNTGHLLNLNHFLKWLDKHDKDDVGNNVANGIGNNVGNDVVIQNMPKDIQNIITEYAFPIERGFANSEGLVIFNEYEMRRRV